MRDEPVGEALVQLRPDALWQRVVGRVADQEVAEAEPVVAGQLSTVGSHELPPDQRCQPRRHLRLLRCQSLHPAPVEELALDRAPLEHPPLGLVQLVEPDREQRLQRRRYLDVLLLAGHRQHLRDEEWIAARGVRDPLVQLSRHLLADQLVGFVVAQGLETQRARPGGMALQQLRPRHAKQQNRCVAREQRGRFD